jgi:hypothetical protein
LDRTRQTHIFIDTGGTYPTAIPGKLILSPGDKIVVSFFGPPSGNLILKLTHSTREAYAIIKASPTSRTWEYSVPSSLTALDITLFPNPSDHPSFALNVRNNLIIEFAQGWSYDLQDIRLQDEARNDYGAACLGA